MGSSSCTGSVVFSSGNSLTHLCVRACMQSLPAPWLTYEYVFSAVDVGGASGTLPGSLSLRNSVLDLQVNKETEEQLWK